MFANLHCTLQSVGMHPLTRPCYSLVVHNKVGHVHHPDAVRRAAEHTLPLWPVLRPGKLQRAQNTPQLPIWWRYGCVE